MTHTLHMNLGKDSYDIIVERGALSRVGELLHLDRRVLILTDTGVPSDYADAVAEACTQPVLMTIPEGESSKSVDVLADIWGVMLECGFTRTDCVVAVGGGVVGDLAGFAAATFMRGVDFYNIPTTLLSQVDSSIGGKTAINHGDIKNCVGAFYQPKAVVVDPDVLVTLDARQLASGMAEAIKMAATCDSALFARMERADRLADMLDDIIVSSLAIKQSVVEQDATEKSLRRVLNFGHTLGHGIESQVAFEAQRGLYHGECVALGMLPMCAPDVRARLVEVLIKAGLPTTLNLDIDAALTAVSHDKKMEGDVIHYVYLLAIGSFEFRKASLAEFAALVKNAGVF